MEKEQQEGFIERVGWRKGDGLFTRKKTERYWIIRIPRANLTTVFRRCIKEDPAFWEKNELHPSDLWKTEGAAISNFRNLKVSAWFVYQGFQLDQPILYEYDGSDDSFVFTQELLNEIPTGRMGRPGE